MNDFVYQHGFGNHFQSEAVQGSLPQAQNSPQNPAHGLYAEQLSGTAFTTPRAKNHRSWLYRIRPSVCHQAFQPYAQESFLSAPTADSLSPNPLRWQPYPYPNDSVDFWHGLVTWAVAGDVKMMEGVAIHLFSANLSMYTSYVTNCDGEMLIVPQEGRLEIHTEFGRMLVHPNQIAVVPRGVKFQVILPDNTARGYVLENYGQPMQLPELGPIGSNGLANARDFAIPVAAYQHSDADCQLIAKQQGRFWQCALDHSPLDVVAWHGNYVPYLYDLTRFNTINTVSYDHPDPSIFTVLTSASQFQGVANVDFVVFPPRWMVAEHSFRPPWYHRNVMSEFMGLIQGCYDAKPNGFVPGGCSLHSSFAAHGPDAEAFKKASNETLEPVRYSNTLAFMFETRLPLLPTTLAMQSDTLQRDYLDCWINLQPQFPA